MATNGTTREVSRAQITRDILDVGRRHLAEHGAAALSLRSVARELGMVSSAVYRYVESRDDLLTRLIVDAYDSLGEQVEAVVDATSAELPSQRWLAAALTVRAWAFAHPHEYALVYGSPVPGYAAPPTTVTSGTRASLALIRIVRDAKQSKQFRRPRRSAVVELDARLSADFDRLRANIDLDIDDATLLDVLIAWTQLFGLVSFELFSQTRGLVDQHEELFAAATSRMAMIIGLR
jgi:AcrR family transcriptional regulator